MDSWLVYPLWFAGSGVAFWAGGLVVLLGLFSDLFTRGRIEILFRNCALALGGFLVIISAIPLAWWLYGLLLGATLVWWFLKYQGLSSAKKFRWLALTCWLLAFSWELPWWLMPVLPKLGKPELLLIGDSISAGISEDEKWTWPKLLSQKHQVQIRDCARMGATVRTAQSQAEKLGEAPGLVLLEIGGNDLLGDTPVAEFEQQLDKLLARVCRKDRTVLMLELPLPPLSNSFGLVQRKLARSHGIYLVPRRLLASVLLSPGATIDGIHLTQDGHKNMANSIWSVVAVAY